MPSARAANEGFSANLWCCWMSHIHWDDVESHLKQPIAIHFTAETNHADSKQKPPDIKSICLNTGYPEIIVNLVVKIIMFPITMAKTGDITRHFFP
jgi:hypothetical protein